MKKLFADVIPGVAIIKLSDGIEFDNNFPTKEIYCTNNLSSKWPFENNGGV